MLGFVSLGPLVLIPAVVLLAVLWRRGLGPEAAGLPAACGAVFLYIAYVQRDGPGTHCTTTANSVACGELLDPRPWLALGLLLVAASVALVAIQSRRRRARES